jgi:hypothetical protein
MEGVPERVSPAKYSKVKSELEKIGLIDEDDRLTARAIATVNWWES